MASNTGENEVGLRKITDMTRLVSLLILALHFYYFCYGAFEHWHLTSNISDRILEKISDAGLFTAFNKTKLIALSFLVISLVGVRGKKTENFNFQQGMTQILIGLLIYFFSSGFLKI